MICDANGSEKVIPPSKIIRNEIQIRTVRPPFAPGAKSSFLSRIGTALPGSRGAGASAAQVSVQNEFALGVISYSVVLGYLWAGSSVYRSGSSWMFLRMPTSYAPTNQDWRVRKGKRAARTIQTLIGVFAASWQWRGGGPTSAELESRQSDTKGQAGRALEPRGQRDGSSLPSHNRKAKRKKLERQSLAGYHHARCANYPSLPVLHVAKHRRSAAFHRSGGAAVLAAGQRRGGNLEVGGADAGGCSAIEMCQSGL
ncbi:hypothetical protein B0H14DRAFT_2611005 [Mycena olivaceomarginata]|nr:hypothetical protein B0H14DRAFT_2611005 [Mycena olivaceomarginata]